MKWAEVVPTARGAVCVWAEETAAGEANILAADLDPDGKPRGMPVRVARGVSGWAVVPAQDGVGLALVTAGAGRAGDSPSPHPQLAKDSGNRAVAGALAWLRLDAAGRPMSAPVAVGSRPTVSGDVDVAATRDGFLLAWTDRTGEDAHVALAFVDQAGHVRGPAGALDALGGSTLAGLAAGEHDALLAWEEPRGRARPMHALHLAMVSTADKLTAQPALSFEIATASAPELAATPDGFALLASARVCESSSPCAGPLAPTFVRFDSRLVPVQAEPMMVGDARSSAALGWGLRCIGNRCSALAAGSEAPTPVYTINLARRPSPFAAPVLAPLPAAAPRLTGISTIASGQAYTDVAAARLAETTFVASMVIGPAGPGGARGGSDHANSRTQGASVTLRRLDDGGQSVSPPETLTSRALAAGGIAMAAGERPEDGVALAWVARDDGDPQVHLARVDSRGRRVAEVALTSARGDASDVAVAWAGDGWLVAWVDGRDGNGEVYATRVDRALRRIAREERITRAPGDAGDVSLAVAGDVAWVAWSDARESPREGIADVYVTTLRTRDAQRVGDETRVLATAGHSRSPALATTDQGAIVAWIEDAPLGVDAPTAGAVMVARVDSRARLMGAPGRLPLSAEGTPSTLLLERAGSAVRAIVARTWRDEVTLDAAVLPAAGDGLPTTAWSLVGLDAPGSFEVALASPGGGALFFDDVGAAGGAHRLRRAAIDWPR